MQSARRAVQIKVLLLIRFTRLHRSFEILPKDSDDDEGLGRGERYFRWRKGQEVDQEQRGVFRKGWWMNRMGWGGGHKGKAQRVNQKGVRQTKEDLDFLRRAGCP